MPVIRLLILLVALTPWACLRPVNKPLDPTNTAKSAVNQANRSIKKITVQDTPTHSIKPLNLPLLAAVWPSSDNGPSQAHHAPSLAEVPQDWGGGAERINLHKLSALSAPPPQSWGTTCHPARPPPVLQTDRVTPDVVTCSIQSGGRQCPGPLHSEVPSGRPEHRAAPIRPKLQFD